MSLGAKFGVAGIALALLVIASGGWYVYKRPLSVYAWFNRRTLASAGLGEATAATGFGPQAYWSGGSGPTLVLLHGAGDQSGTWANVVERLTGTYRLVIPDLAGHGRSAPAQGPIELDQVLRGVESILSQGPQDPAIIVGNSLGAWIGLLYAHAHPDRVARLVLVNGGALRGDRPDLSLTPRTRAEAAALMKELRDPGSDPIRDFVLDDVVREAQSGPLARFAATAARMEPYLLDGRLHEVRVSVDLIWGESDRLFTLDYARRMMAALPASRLRTLPACGHVPHQECPARFGAALTDVLASPPPMPVMKNARRGPT
ncbi:MAG: alpha/beta fold hydrolase [Acidobacteriota bacterium]